jgi:hypothetical protein
MIDPILRCQQLAVRFENMADRFAKASLSPESSTEIGKVLSEIEGNENNPINVYWLELWLFNHGV